MKIILSSEINIKKRIGNYQVFCVHRRLLLAIYNCFLLLPNFTLKSHLHESNSFFFYEIIIGNIEKC